ncbi:hypothetical protein DRO59_06380 [Candidatus Bathyarchaeota archaeon]|nr:MAG: hypothetical protein DRO59_06380 [Candidatus Bathyarchaeota archaeon]
MHNKILKLVIIQFAVYSAVCVLGFALWAIVFSGNLWVVEELVGEYIRGHLVRWTTKLPSWGIFVLISGVLFMSAVRFLRQHRMEGAYLGITSFLIGFLTNLLFARNLLVHGILGCLIGWTLLAPLILLWEHLKK